LLVCISSFETVVKSGTQAEKLSFRKLNHDGTCSLCKLGKPLADSITSALVDALNVAAGQVGKDSRAHKEPCRLVAVSNSKRRGDNTITKTWKRSYHSLAFSISHLWKESELRMK